MAQNNAGFLFVQKTSNDSCGRPNLRIDMNQATNLKSLGFTWRKVADLLVISTEVFNPHISVIVRFVVNGVAKLLFESVLVEADDSPSPTL